MSLDAYSAYGNVWVEITKSTHNHGGLGWEFGTCLWSPSSNELGSNRYSLMQKPEKGHLVLHFLEGRWPDGSTDTRLCGASRVAGKVRTVTTQPSTPGDWGERSAYFRIDLTNFTSFPKPLPLTTLVKEYRETIWQELVETEPKFYPFYIYGKRKYAEREKQSLRTVQGIYLAHCTPQLYQTFRHGLGLEEAKAEGQV